MRATALFPPPVSRSTPSIFTHATMNYMHADKSTMTQISAPLSSSLSRHSHTLSEAAHRAGNSSIVTLHKHKEATTLWFLPPLPRRLPAYPAFSIAATFCPPHTNARRQQRYRHRQHFETARSNDSFTRHPRLNIHSTPRHTQRPHRRQTTPASHTARGMALRASLARENEAAVGRAE